MNTVIQQTLDFLGNLGPDAFRGTWRLAVVGLGFAAFESIWRRWFGGGFKGVAPFKWFNKRFLKHCLNVAAMTAVAVFVRGIPLPGALCLAVFLQVCFWTLTFGMYFDIGRGGQPRSEYDVEEYNKTWFAGALNWFFPEGTRYTAFYDYCGMTIRFTWPMAFAMFVPTFNSGMLCVGPLVALAYAYGWTCFEKKGLKFTGPTEFGEFASGAVFGWYLVTCGMM